MHHHIALLLFVLGALGIYTEFLRPGWILPGVIGATFLVLSLRGLAHFTAGWPAATLVAVAIACFGLASSTGFTRLLILSGAISLTAAATLLTTPVLGILLGAPFAAITGFLADAAIRARRNKTHDV